MKRSSILCAVSPAVPGRTLSIDANAADVADRIVFIENGRIVSAGTPDSIIRQPEPARARPLLAPWFKRSLNRPGLESA